MRLDRFVTQQRAPPHCQTAHRLLLRGPAPTRAPLLHVGGPWRILPVGRPRHKQQRAFIHEVPALRSGGRAWEPSRARVAHAGHLHSTSNLMVGNNKLRDLPAARRGAFTPATAYLNEATTPSSPDSARGSRLGAIVMPTLQQLCDGACGTSKSKRLRSARGITCSANIRRNPVMSAKQPNDAVHVEVLA